VQAAALHAAAEDKAQKQNEINKMPQATLQQLYKAEPKAKRAVANAYGYAVFSDTGVKILLAGSGNGQGVAVNNHTKQETFMKMLELQAVLGMGVTKFRVVFVFDTKPAFNGFVNSAWEFGGQSTAAAKTGEKGAPQCQERHREEDT
jgi:lipid-binding SYLF domain-containing protein